MKSKLEFDAEAFSAEDCARLSAAIDFVEGDAPLVVEILTVSQEEIQTLNRTQRKIDRVTDVLSFPSMEGIKGKQILQDEHGEELDEEGRIFLGSVVICEARAKQQAQEYGHSYERELFYLAVHGVLHCLGYDHESEDERAEMRALEEHIMKKMNLPREA